MQAQNDISEYVCPFAGLESDFDAVEVKKNSAVQYPCGQCHGTGKYHGPRVHQEKAHCFACRGTGYFLSSPEVRARQKQARVAKKNDKAQELLKRKEAFGQAHPELYKELVKVQREGSTSEFITSLASRFDAKGELSENQIAAWTRGREKLNALIAERKAQEAARPVIDLTPIIEIFQNAISNGHKKPKYRANGVVLNLAPATGVNAGAIYVKTDDGDYAGKLVDQKFKPLRGFEGLQEVLLDIAKDPLAAAVAYGRKTGKCACCGRALDNKESVERGIGPICADKWGL